MRVRLGLMAFILVGAAGCDFPFHDSSSAGARTCASVWVEDKVLPKPYDGCLKGSRFVKPKVVVDCRDFGGPIAYGFLVKNGFLAANPGKKIAFYETQMPRDSSISAYSFSCDKP